MLRDYAKISREEMGIEIGMSADNVYTYEQRNVEPKPITLAKYAEVFNIPEETLRGELLSIKRVREIWNPSLKYAKDGSLEPQNLNLAEEPVEYKTDSKEINQEEVLVETTVKNNAMLRVLLRSQAELLAAQRKQPLKKILAEMNEQLKAEIESEYDEL